ncbi:hypothetical protein TSA66_06440 [Noviherbaspirillum autotrophicum]|uniref:Uncharacterized protein n=2 Tax=Noviherbaspirillum autotrophicum TaxID=709839 RepID=A0A0C2BKL9_9BURK|nr:hypothetical protein TSA66_06440 [Noviherbaspirillum autotrophicum]
MWCGGQRHCLNVFGNSDEAGMRPAHQDIVIGRRRDDDRRKKALRYLAEAEPEQFRQQLPLEQVPMKGAP